MRKLLLVAIVSLFTLSCQNEQRQIAEPLQTVESAKSDGMRTFDDALKGLSRSKGKYVGTDKQLSAEGIELLYPGAKKIVLEAGLKEDEIRVKGKKEILKLAATLYHKNLAQYRNDIKSIN